ncbi:uncharacterized protein LY89DRAFT_734748 [Mollisia scopiformis]|uniref:DUF7708 domain-containing protein n=1 Tax=Mollisia scopiformis TaxID=149040 RepID=A0A194X957_MOLSC|nr:uncharacterized protein LY89DRAFT_734748 [Mollisia scopiformis]KUJ16654.1 hypothetical protein LY89DRAFT_734748 [Mollisia scopiformis]
MAQETFLIAKSVLRKFKDPPETRRLEFISPTTLEACSRAARNLQHLEMTSEESEILDQSQNIEMVREFIAQYVAEVDKRRQYSKTWGKVYAFSQFAGPVLDVFKQANFSPECSVALGLISLLLIQPLNNKSDIEERLEKEIMQLKDIISQVEFSKSNIRTAEIDAEVQGLCGAIIDFLVHALQYQKKWGIAKVLSGILADFAKRFESFVTKIKSHATKIGVLAQRGYTTILLNSKDILDTTAQGKR